MVAKSWNMTESLNNIKSEDEGIEVRGTLEVEWCSDSPEGNTH